MIQIEEKKYLFPLLPLLKMILASVHFCKSNSDLLDMVIAVGWNEEVTVNYKNLKKKSIKWTWAHTSHWPYATISSLLEKELLME